MVDPSEASKPSARGGQTAPQGDEDRSAGESAHSHQESSPPSSNNPSVQQVPGPLHDATRSGQVSSESGQEPTQNVPPLRDTTPDGNWEIPWSNRQRVPRDLHPRLERLGERTEDFVDTVEVAIGKAVPRPLRVLQSARQNTMINVVWRAGVLVVGLAFVASGLAMLLLPGPGWASIILGLVILASEYTWANRLLSPVRSRARAAAARARQWDPRVQRAITVSTILGMVVVVVVSVWYVKTNGLSLPW